MTATCAFSCAQAVKRYDRAMLSCASASVQKLDNAGTTARNGNLVPASDIGLAGAHALAQTLGLFPQMSERRLVRQLIGWNSDLLARAWRAGGLWSAASGEEAALP